MYCDLGKVASIEIQDIDSIIELSTQGYFGVRGYLFPPSSSLQCIPSNLSTVFDEIARTNLTLFIDPSIPNPRMLYIASPHRLVSIEERFESQEGSSTKIFAAAFPDAIESDEEENEEIRSPYRIRRQTSTNEMGIFTRPSIHRSISSGNVLDGANHDLGLQIESIPEEDEDLLGSPKKKKNFHTIFDDLDKRIKQSQNNIENLSKAEQFTYEQSGSTSYTSLSPVHIKTEIHASDTESSTSTIPSPKQTAYQSRIANRRPPNLTIKAEEKSSKERIYMNHLANFPDHWEILGIEKIIQGLKKSVCRVHINNLSSAAALNKVRQAKEEFPTMTCEISASHLCFTSASIKDGDTRFKTIPPIRNQSNLLLLWDLLKMKGIDVITSAHASIKPELKAIDKGNFLKALNGISSIGFSLQSV